MPNNMMLPIFDEECDIYTLYVYCIGTTFPIGCVNEVNRVVMRFTHQTRYDANNLCIYNTLIYHFHSAMSLLYLYVNK